MKTCIRCNQSKAFEAFYKHKGMKDGTLNKCKECTVKDVAEWRVSNPDSRKREHARIRERKGFQTREEYSAKRAQNKIGRKASSLKYAYKRRRLAEKMFQTEFDILLSMYQKLPESVRASSAAAKQEQITRERKTSDDVYLPMANDLFSDPFKYSIK